MILLIHSYPESIVFPDLDGPILIHAKSYFRILEDLSIPFLSISNRILESWRISIINRISGSYNPFISIINHIPGS